MIKEWFEFVGLMLGDGSMAGRAKAGEKSCLYVGENDAEEIKSKVLFPLGLEFDEFKMKSIRQFVFQPGITEKLGWFREKKIPKLEDLSDIELASVLRGCFEADGGLSGKWNQIVFVNVRKDLAEFVGNGLERLGLRCSVRKYRSWWYWKGLLKEGIRYHVCVHKGCGGGSLFREKVGFLTGMKVSKSWM